MKHLVAFLAVAALLAAVAGCEKQEKKPEEPQTYDPNVDAPPTVLEFKPDPNLLADQSRLAGRSAVAAVATAPTEAATEAAEPSETGVEPAPATPAQPEEGVLDDPNAVMRDAESGGVSPLDEP